MNLSICGTQLKGSLPDAASGDVRVSGVVPRQRSADVTMVVSHPDQVDQLRRIAPGYPVFRIDPA